HKPSSANTSVAGDWKTPTECPASNNFCRTISTSTTFSRTCEEPCVSEVNVHCCHTDLCR
ncbi:hypothetical protein P4O66_018059, partial [Electrophorus voltai]